MYIMVCVFLGRVYGALQAIAEIMQSMKGVCTVTGKANLGGIYVY
jgi:hypothetical protein